MDTSQEYVWIGVPILNLPKRLRDINLVTPGPLGDGECGGYSLLLPSSNGGTEFGRWRQPRIVQRTVKPSAVVGASPAETDYVISSAGFPPQPLSEIVLRPRANGGQNRRGGSK
jgi:hypothetical protein